MVISKFNSNYIILKYNNRHLIVNTLVLVYIFFMRKSLESKKLFVSKSKFTAFLSAFMSTMVFFFLYDPLLSYQDHILLLSCLLCICLLSCFTILSKTTSQIYLWSIAFLWILGGFIIFRFDITSASKFYVISVTLVGLVLFVSKEASLKLFISYAGMSIVLNSILFLISDSLAEFGILISCSAVMIIILIKYANFFQMDLRRLKSARRLHRLIKKLNSEKKRISDIALSQTNFLASIGHDLRQPIHAINLYTGSLEKLLLGTSLSKSQELKSFETLKRLKQSIKYMNDILESLLEASRLDQGVTFPKISRVYINKFCKEIIGQHRENVKEKGLKIEFITNLSSQHYLETDKRLLERIVRNFISNAVKYTSEGGIRVRVTGTNSHCRISVVDTGQGIPLKMKRRIFEEFSRGHLSHSALNRGGGIGLGLSISRRLSAKIGGNITVQSRLKIGSIFSITLPRTKLCKTTSVNEQLESQLISEVLPQITFTEPSSTIILLVDSDSETRYAIESLGPDLRVKIISGNSGQEVINKYQKIDFPPKLLLIDSDNEVEETSQTIEIISDEFNQSIPAIIFCSDLANQSLLLNSTENIVFLQKPFQILTLQEKITETIFPLTSKSDRTFKDSDHLSKS